MGRWPFVNSFEINHCSSPNSGTQPSLYKTRDCAFALGHQELQRIVSERHPKAQQARLLREGTIVLVSNLTHGHPETQGHYPSQAVNFAPCCHVHFLRTHRRHLFLADFRHVQLANPAPPTTLKLNNQTMISPVCRRLYVENLLHALQLGWLTSCQHLWRMQCRMKPMSLVESHSTW